MMDIKELIIASAEAAQNLGIGQLLWTDKPEGKQWEAAFERIAECRKRCLESMENPRVNESLKILIPCILIYISMQLYVAGKVYQFWLVSNSLHTMIHCRSLLIVGSSTTQ